jgi:hypothetical protein
MPAPDVPLPLATGLLILSLLSPPVAHAIEPAPYARGRLFSFEDWRTPFLMQVSPHGPIV